MMFRAAVRVDGLLSLNTWILLFSHPKLRHSNTFNLRIEVRAPARIRRTLRDGSLGCDRPGTSCQATIVLSLRDKDHSPAGGIRNKLALMGLTLGPGLPNSP